MDFMKPLNDIDFLKEFKSSYSTYYINNSKHDVHSLISGLVFFEAPDYVNERDYVERFTVDAYERVSIKPQKFTSLHRTDESAMRKRANTLQNLFHTVRYSTPDNRTNTRHLKKNVRNMIAQKTQKIASYNAKYPNAVYRHLLIELDCHCRVFIDENGSFFSSAVPTDGLSTVDYEIYRDKTFIDDLKSEFGKYWDLLLFVKRFADYGAINYFVFCVDLKQDIVNENMIAYPEKIFQIIQGGLISYKIDGGKKTRNILYSCNDDEMKRLLFSKPPQYIKIDGVHFRKDKTHDSIYFADALPLFFELSQFSFKFDNHVDYIKLVKIEHFLQETLTLPFDNKQIALTRLGVSDGYTFNIFV